MTRVLLRLSNREPRRTEFLLEASQLLLGAAHADSLELRLEDRDQLIVWRADRGAPHEFDVRTLGAAKTRGALANAVLADLTRPGARTEPAQRASGALWIPDGDGRGGAVALLPFGIDERNQGVLRLDISDTELAAAPDLESLEVMAELLGVAIANRRSQAALAERVKELACMYRLAQIGAEAALPLERMLQEIVELLPSAWQYPDITTARITFDDAVHKSRNFEEGPHRLVSDITVWGAPRGRVEVFYAQRHDPRSREPLPDESPFLAEEHHLIDGVARELASIIERKHADDEKSRLRDQLRHADRLATIGQLAAGVAHELNEPLGNILGFAQLALKAPGLAEQARADIDRIVTASLYSREIIKKLMFFARQTPSQQRGDVSLNEIVEDALPLLSSRCDKAGVEVVRSLSASAPRVRCDRAQLQQVLINLVVNAIQAMHNGGTLTLATAMNTTTATLAVEDTGAGIPEHDLDRIFLPFFTTKEVGEGTGLGLSVVHGIVAAHDGTVRVQSKPGRGTRFEVELPTHDGSSCQRTGEGE